MSGEEPQAVFETESAIEMEKFREAGWVVLRELPAPPASGGVTFVLGWVDVDPVQYPEGHPR